MELHPNIDRDLLKQIYLFVYGAFATDVTEVAGNFGISRQRARKMLRLLEDAELVVSTDVNQEAQGAARHGQYKELTWQSWMSIDVYKQEEVAQNFEETFPFPVRRHSVHPAILRITLTDGSQLIYGPYSKLEADLLAERLQKTDYWSDCEIEAESLVKYEDEDFGV